MAVGSAEGDHQKLNNNNSLIEKLAHSSLRFKNEFSGRRERTRAHLVVGGGWTRVCVLFSFTLPPLRYGSGEEGANNKSKRLSE